MDEVRRTLERAGLATLGGDRDYLLAMGVAAFRGNAAALPLLRLHLAATREDFLAARACVRTLIERLRRAGNLRLRPADLEHVADIALAHHICPVCRHCHGLKFKLMADGHTPSAMHCPHCRGDGRRAVQSHLRGEIECVLAALERQDNQTEANLRGILG